MNGRIRNLIELNTAVLMWGGTALFSKWIVLPAFEISGLRSIPAVAALLAAAWLSGQSLRVRDVRDFALLLATGLVLTIHWVTYFQAMQVSSVAVGILSLHTYPVMTALAEPLVFKERLRMVDVAVAVVVLLGVAILVPSFSLDNNVTWGVLWGVLSAVFFTVRNLLSRPLVKRYPAGQLMLYQLVVCAVVLAPFIATSGEPVSTTAIWQLALLGIVFTALPHTLFTSSMQHLSIKTVSVIATLLPVYGTILAALLLGEIPTTRTLIGGAVILAAVFFETWQVVKRHQPQIDCD